MNKYPIYIVSKGRYDNPITAKSFIKDGIDFKILVEPQEYDLYCKSLDKKYVLKLPFSNLGVGSYPARNYAWKHSTKNGFKKHWVFDDNIYGFSYFYKGKKISIDGKIAFKVIENFLDRYKNIAVGGFNYHSFVVANSIKKPFYFNTHCYSAMLITNSIPYRWRLKYNEDVDLCLQALNGNYITVLFNLIQIRKVSTSSKMKGGNQTELYQNNNEFKKALKTRSLEKIWPQYVKSIVRFGRPHHFVDWKKYFSKNKIIKSKDYDELCSNSPKIIINT
jgi:hypothetical protein